MKPYTAINPVFHDTIQITETSDSAHADNINAAPKVLLENTLSNRQAIEELKTSTGSTEESEYSAVSAYQPGDYCIYNNELYRCIAAIVQGEQWNAQHWVKTTIANELLLLNKKEIEIKDTKLTNSKFIDLVNKVSNHTLTSKNLKDILDTILESEKEIDEIMKEKGISNITDTSVLESVVKKIILDNPESVADYQNGKDRAVKYLMGQIMKETKGSANPKMVNDILMQELNSN